MKLIQYILLLGVTFSFISCEDFLDASPITKKTTANYYANSDEASEALTGCYDGVQLIYSAASMVFPMAAVVMADHCFGGTGVGDADNYLMVDQHDLTFFPTGQNEYDDSWSKYYTAIYRCNVLLQNMDNVEWEAGEESLKDEITAEARFLRAYCYFDMTRLWGKVPLLTVPTEAIVPQTDIDLIYKQIADDLLFAAEYGKDNTYGELKGHATKWSAMALLGRVYLFYKGYHNKETLVATDTEVTASVVLDYLEELIAESGHGLLKNYYDLWPAASTYEAAKNGLSIDDATYAGEINEEIIFGIRYTYTSDYNGNADGNHWMVMNGLRGKAWGASGYGEGWGACTVDPAFYSGWDDNDTRKDASIMAIDEEGITYTKKNIDGVKEYTGYFTKKYVPTSDKFGSSVAVNYGGVNFMIGQFQDYFSIRYSDVLLMAAELGSPNALDYADQVHFRATNEHLSDLTDDILKEERKYEFAFEGIRYWDLLRYGLDYAASKISYNGTVLTGGNEKSKVIDGERIKITKGLVPIPKSQITLTGDEKALIQNDGWK